MMHRVPGDVGREGGKKTPMPLAHFGRGKHFEVLSDTALPDTPADEWMDNKQATAQRESRDPRPFPSVTRLPLSLIRLCSTGGCSKRPRSACPKTPHTLLNLEELTHVPS